MADDKPAGQATTDPGKGTILTPAAAAAPAAGANADPNAKPAEGGNPAAGDGGQAGAQAGTEGNKDGAQAGASKVPDKYDLKVPEGADAHVDAADLEAWATKAKAEGWTNEEAQQHLDTLAEQLVSQMTAFRTVTESDPTYGKANLEANQQLARRFIDRVRPAGHARSESFQKFLTKTGAGNHLELFAFLADAGRLLKEDTPPQATGGGKGDQKTAADVLYGKTE